MSATPTTPAPKTNIAGLTVLDYRGGKTTLCAGCGHNAISERIIDAAYEMAVKNGMTVTMPPTDEPWSVREFHLRHPDGHTFRVSAGLEDE